MNPYSFISNLIVMLLAFASGIFVVLSLIEKPTWKLMTDPDSKLVSDETTRLIHGALKRLIHLLPPTMITTMSSLLLLLVTQAILTHYQWQAIAVLLIFILAMSSVVTVLKSRIDAVDHVSSEANIRDVRHGLGALALLHHKGLLAALVTLMAQFFLVVFRN